MAKSPNSPPCVFYHYSGARICTRIRTLSPRPIASECRSERETERHHRWCKRLAKTLPTLKHYYAILFRWISLGILHTSTHYELGEKIPPIKKCEIKSNGNGFGHEIGQSTLSRWILSDNLLALLPPVFITFRPVAFVRYYILTAEDTHNRNDARNEIDEPKKKEKTKRHESCFFRPVQKIS